jgi:hypothetical protein
VAQDNQLALELPGVTGNDLNDEQLDRLNELAIVHAGNPDDGCCAIWIGAPRSVSTPNGCSTWAWVEPIYCIERIEQPGSGASPQLPPAHTDLTSPDVPLELREDDEQPGDEGVDQPGQ